MSASRTFFVFLFAFAFTLRSSLLTQRFERLERLERLERFERFKAYLKPYSFHRCNTARRIVSTGSATSPRKFSLIVKSSISFEVTPSAVAEGSKVLVIPRGITYMSVAG